MKKIFLLLQLFITDSICFSQSMTSEAVYLDSGKNEFKLQAKKDTSDYRNAYRILSKQVKQNPRNAELHYFLGYAIDRLNADDAKAMAQVKKEMTLKASEQFEKVIRLEPIYKGEIFILDPYAKLSSIWGSLAQAYLTRNDLDSAKWAFKEGKRRGGFQGPILELNRQLLNSCDKDAILITNGDNITIPLWYLQTVDNYRNDIIVVDGNMIAASWYAKYLRSERKLKISLSDAVLDTIEYQKWSSQEVSAFNKRDSTQKFTWELKPTYMDGYVLKGDRILLDVFQQNFFDKPIYFTNYSDSSYNLFLTPYLRNEGLVDRVTTKIFDYTQDVVTVPKNLYAYNIDKIKMADIEKSRDALLLLNSFRWAFYKTIYQLAIQANYEEAKKLINLMSKKFEKSKLPYASLQSEENYFNFFKQIDSNYH